MTTSLEDEGFDRDLSLCLQLNQTEKHLSAPITTNVYTREGQALGNAFTRTLNEALTGDVLVEIQCPKDEAILMGSIRFYATGVVKCFKVADGQESANWQTHSHNGGNGTFMKLQADNNGTGGIHVPQHIMNSQFTQIDLQVGRTQSVNAYLSQTRGSQTGWGSLSMMSHYFNEPAEKGCYSLNSTSDFGTAHRRNLVVDRATAKFQLQERLYHQLNIPNNVLSSWDYDDHECRKILPRGLGILIKGSTRPYTHRMFLRFGGGDGFNTHRFELHFHDVRVFCTTVKIPMSGHRQQEPIETVFATMDFGIRSYPLAENQRSVQVQVTYTDNEFIPQWVFVFVAEVDIFHSYKQGLGPGLPVKPGCIVKVRCNLNGNLSPDFMSMFHDSCISLDDLIQKCDMINAFLGRAGWMPGRSRLEERTPAEQALLSYAETDPNALALHSALIMTDPSSAIVRESSSGVLSGRLDLMIDFSTLEGKKVPKDSALFIVCVAKQEISVLKVKELEGSNPQYEFNAHGTKPAFTSVQVVEDE